MSDVFFDVKQPENVGRILLDFNFGEYSQVPGIDGLLAMMTHSEKFVSIDFCDEAIGPISSIAKVNALPAGREIGVRFALNNREVAGVIRHT